MGDIYYVDGKFLPDDAAALPVNDLAVLRGFGIFDFLRTYGGKPFHLADHLKRLENSSKTIDLPLPAELPEIRDIVMETLRKNDHEESNIRVVVTGGPAQDFMVPDGQPRLVVSATPVVPMPRHWYVEGVKVVSAPFERQIPGAKGLNYLEAVFALKRAYRKNAAEAVYTDKRGYIKEGTTSNFFAFVGGKLVTPGTDKVLAGITRKVVLSLASDFFEIEIRDIGADEIENAEGAFLTSSNKEVLPVVFFDDIEVGDGKPSAPTRRIMDMFRDYTEKYAANDAEEDAYL